jgi:lipid A 3-O-deacylase
VLHHDLHTRYGKGDKGMRGTMAAAAAAAILISSAGAWAADRPALLSFGVGQFDTDWIDTGEAGLYFDVGENAGRDEAPEFRLEYRFGTSLWSPTEWFQLRPFVGGAATGDGMLYGVGGLLLDMQFGNFVFTPSFGAGLWSRGSGKDLGYPVEFRTMFEAGYRFENDARVTVGFSHMSNANLDGHNPGANSLMLYFHMPTGYLFGN